MYSITSGRVPRRNRLISKAAHLITTGFVTHFNHSLTSVPSPHGFDFAAVFVKFLNHLPREFVRSWKGKFGDRMQVNLRTSPLLAFLQQVPDENACPRLVLKLDRKWRTVEHPSPTSEPYSHQCAHTAGHSTFTKGPRYANNTRPAAALQKSHCSPASFCLTKSLLLAVTIPPSSLPGQQQLRFAPVSGIVAKWLQGEGARQGGGT